MKCPDKPPDETAAASSPRIVAYHTVIPFPSVVQSPFRAQIQTEPLDVYFQIYHLVPDALGITSYRTVCILLPRDEQDLRKGIGVYKSEKTGKEEMAAVFCQIDVHSVNPGQYNLIVSVTDRKRVQTLTVVREMDILKP